MFDRPTPATTAEPLADIFLTAQFRLALLIASVAYFWRYHAGARLRHPRFDYMEALGFAAHAAAADLPKVFWQTCHSSERRCSNSSTVSVPVSILARTSRSHYKLTWRDRWFESGFLQRRVSCEPDFLDQGGPLGSGCSAGRDATLKSFFGNLVRYLILTVTVLKLRKGWPQTPLEHEWLMEPSGGLRAVSQLPACA